MLVLKLCLICIAVKLITCDEVQNDTKHHKAPDYKPRRDYSFSYGVRDTGTGDIKSQWEKKNGDSVKGQYTLLEPDGSVRTVEYSVNGNSGFNAVVKTEGKNVHPITQSSTRTNIVMPSEPIVKPIEFAEITEESQKEDIEAESPATHDLKSSAQNMHTTHVKPRVLKFWYDILDGKHSVEPTDESKDKYQIEETDVPEGKYSEIEHEIPNFEDTQNVKGTAINPMKEKSPKILFYNKGDNNYHTINPIWHQMEFNPMPKGKVRDYLGEHDITHIKPIYTEDSSKSNQEYIEEDARYIPIVLNEPAHQSQSMKPIIQETALNFEVPKGTDMWKYLNTDVNQYTLTPNGIKTNVFEKPVQYIQRPIQLIPVRIIQLQAPPYVPPQNTDEVKYTYKYIPQYQNPIRHTQIPQNHKKIVPKIALNNIFFRNPQQHSLLYEDTDQDALGVVKQTQNDKPDIKPGPKLYTTPGLKNFSTKNKYIGGKNIPRRHNTRIYSNMYN